MDWSIPVGQGSLRCTPAGDRVELLLRVPNDGKGLYKAFLKGETGRVLEFGSLLPDGKELALGRSLPMAVLRQGGCWPIVSCELRLAHQFGRGELPQGWQKEENPSGLFQDPYLQREVARYPRVLLCRNQEGFHLALPYGRNKPFPMTALFCFARIRHLGGGDFAVFAFDPQGRPRCI